MKQFRFILVLVLVFSGLPVILRAGDDRHQNIEMSKETARLAAEAMRMGPHPSEQQRQYVYQAITALRKELSVARYDFSTTCAKIDKLDLAAANSSSVLGEIEKMLGIHSDAGLDKPTKRLKPIMNAIDTLKKLANTKVTSLPLSAVVSRVEGHEGRLGQVERVSLEANVRLRHEIERLILRNRLLEQYALTMSNAVFSMVDEWGKSALSSNQGLRSVEQQYGTTNDTYEL
ncbi:MAG: hypothetical protein HZA95_01835 [Candidatus Vogelbacteria bacterium]|nr:hypothetical protein [Candidatus Vogelbacteria bacterium]